MRSLLYCIFILTAWPADLFYFFHKTHYVDKKSQSKRIKGKAIIVSNHTSLLDYILYVFMFAFRNLHCLISTVVYEHNKFVNFFLWMIGGIKVNRKNYDLSFLDKSLEKLNKNKVLVVFPEGKLERNKGELVEFSPTYIYLALKSNSPIIPVFNEGNYGFFKKNNVIIGKKIYVRDYCKSENPTKEEIQYINELVKKEINRLKNQLYKNKENKKEKKISLKNFLWDFGRFNLCFFTIFRRPKIIYYNQNKKILKKKGPFIICANHTSFYDPTTIYRIFWRRRINVLGANIIFENHPVRSYFLKCSGVIKINRNIADIEAIKECKKVLENKGILTIFPEGKIGKEENLQEFKNGAVLISTLTKSPILPLLILNKGKGKMVVVIGEMIEIDKNKIYSLKEMEKLTSFVQSKFNEMNDYAKELGYGKK